jgi:hypothetical protein
VGKAKWFEKTRAFTFCLSHLPALSLCFLAGSLLVEIKTSQHLFLNIYRIRNVNTSISGAGLVFLLGSQPE